MTDRGWCHPGSRGGLVLFSTRKKDPHKFLYALKERVTSAGALRRKRRGENLLKTPLQAFELFLAFGNPGKERGGEEGGCFLCIFKMGTNKRFVKREVNAGVCYQVVTRLYWFWSLACRLQFTPHPCRVISPGHILN